MKKVLLSKRYIYLRCKQHVLFRRVRDCHQSRFLTNLLPLTTSWQHLEMTIPRKVVLIYKVVLFLSCSIVLTMMRLKNDFSYLLTLRITGCVNSICDTLNAIKNALLSYKNCICTFMRCGHLTYDTWIWLKITPLSSTASVLKECQKSIK